MEKGVQTRLLASTAILLVWIHGGVAFGQSPQGGSVAAGSVSIARQGETTVITQTSQRGAIDWRSFSVGPQETVRFDQPGRSSVTLNRVTGSELSRIDGNITANGQVWLANPNGVVIGPSGQVNVGGLLATTGRIDAQEFLRSGRAEIDEIARDAAIVNSGAVMIAEGGYAALAAASIRNEGLIAARAGSVALAAGRAATLDFVGDKLIQYQVTQGVQEAPAGGDALIVNSGTIAAQGGAVLLSARAAKGVIDNVVNLKGHVISNSVRVDGGTVVFGDGGTVQVSAKIDASNPNGVGGTVSVLGEKVGLMDGALVDASGAQGGGVVLVGGDWQGKGAGQNASIAFVAPGAAINVDATQRGDGGMAVVWADDTTRFNGVITAQGGSQGGDGGLVETSGKRALQIGDAARVSTAARAPAARPGSWLLDPNSITVAVGGEINISAPQTFTAVADTTATVNAITLQNALATGNVILQTTTAFTSGLGDITIATGVSISYAGSNSLSFLANRDISLASGATLNFTGAGSITFNARYAGAAIGGVSIAGRAIVGTGALVIGGGATPLTGSATGGGAQTTGVLVTGRLESSGGAITINGKGASSGGYGVQVTGGTIVGGGGNVTINGTGDGTPSSSTGVGLGPNAFVTSSGVITVNGVGSASGGAGSYGLDFYDSTISATGGGSIDLALTAGGGGSQGLWLNGANMLLGTGSLTVKANSIGAGGTIAINGGTGSITLQGLTTGTSLGFNSGAGTLNVTPLMSAITGTPTQVTLGRSDMAANVTGGATAYTLPFDLRILSGTGAVNIGGAINSSASGVRSLTVTNSGTTSFAGAIGGATPLATVSVSSGTTYLNGGVTTSQASTGSISFAGRVILASNTTLSTSNSPIYVAQVDALNSGIQSLAFAAGTAPVTLDVGSNFGIGSFASLNTINSSGSGGIVSNLGGGRLQSSGTQSYAGPVTMVGTGLIISTTNSDVTFSGGINPTTSGGAFLIANTGTTGTLSLVGGAGAVTPMASLTFGSIAAGGMLRSASSTAPIGMSSLRLLSNLTVQTSHGVSVTNTIVSGATSSSLTLTTGSASTVGGSIGGGSTPLSSLTVTGGQPLTLNGAVTTVDSQSYSGSLIIGASLSLSTTNNANISIAGAVNGSAAGRTLGASIGTGTISLAGGSGGTTPLANLNLVSSAAALSGAFITDGPQTYSTATLVGATTFATTGGSLFISGNVSGAQALTVNTGTGSATINNTLGSGANLTSFTSLGSGVFTVGGAVRTSGTQSYTGPVVIPGSTTFESTAGANVTFSNTLNGASIGGQQPNFSIGTGTVSFVGAVGGTTPLASLTVGNVSISGAVVTAGTQSYGAGVLIAGPANLRSTSSSIVFAGAVNSTTAGANSLTIDLLASGATPTFGAAIGGANSLQTVSLSLTAANLLLPAITTGNLSVTNAGATGYITLGALNASGAVNLSTAGPINSTSPFTANSVAVASVGGALTNATINGQTGASAAGLAVINSGSITINGVLRSPAVTTASTASTPSVASTPSQASVASAPTQASVATQVSVPTVASAPSLASGGQLIPVVAPPPPIIAAPVGVDRILPTSNAASILAQLLPLTPALNFAFANAVLTGGLAKDAPVSPASAAQAHALVANTPTGALIPPIAPFLSETGAPMASSPTIKVDAADSGGGFGGQVIATSSEGNVVVPGLLTNGGTGRNAGARGTEPPLAQLPSTMNEESMLD